MGGALDGELGVPAVPEILRFLGRPWGSVVV